MSEDEIIRYYETCEVDYRVNWRLDASKSLHYGYWDAGTRSFAEALQNTHRELARLAEVRGGERVLDAGCGVGGGALWLARHHRCRVVGISLVEGQVRQAIANAQAAGVGALCGFDRRSYLATGWDGPSSTWSRPSSRAATPRTRLISSARCAGCSAPAAAWWWLISSGQRSTWRPATRL